MSDKIDNGGPAFPIPSDSECAREEGMSLRDYFAGQALGAAFREMSKVLESGAIDVSEFREAVATSSYEIADAMLAARKEKQ